jgi:hypothetical protein
MRAEVLGEKESFEERQGAADLPQTFWNGWDYLIR